MRVQSPVLLSSESRTVRVQLIPERIVRIKVKGGVRRSPSLLVEIRRLRLCSLQRCSAAARAFAGRAVWVAVHFKGEQSMQLCRCPPREK